MVIAIKKGKEILQCGYLLPIFLIYVFFNSYAPRHFFKKKMGLFEKGRVFCLQLLGTQLEKGAVVRKGLFITDFSKFKLGKNSTLGPFAKLFLFDNFTVGDNVEIGSGLTVHTSEHLLDDATKPLGKQSSLRAPVSIASDVYLGSNVTILSGAQIDSRVVVGACSLVKGHLESGFLYAGVPARKIKPLAK